VTRASGIDPVQIQLAVSRGKLWRFFTLLRRGFVLFTPLPCHLEILLCERLEIPQDYVIHRIQTVFVNGRAVDDVSTARVADGAVVALSAAMPGLVGATLRRGGRLTRLRSAISHRCLDSIPQDVAPGLVTIKLFNLVCDELGPVLLARGVDLPPGDLDDFLADHWDEIAAECRSVRVDGAFREPGARPALNAPGRPVHLQVMPAE
jgi:hypothetical protein